MTSGSELARLVGEDLVKVGAMKLRVGRAVLLLVLFGQREALNDLAGVVQAEHIGAGAHADGVDRGSQDRDRAATCCALALIWMPAPISPSCGACS